MTGLLACFCLFLLGHASPTLAVFPYRVDFVPPEPLLLSAPLPGGSSLQLLFQPHRIAGLKEGSIRTFSFLHRFNASVPQRAVVRFRSEDLVVTRVVSPQNATLTSETNSAWHANLSFVANSTAFNSSLATRVALEGLRLGRSNLRIEVFNGSHWRPFPGAYKVSVVRQLRWIDKSFSAAIITLVIIANLGMGTKLELKVVKEVLKKPLAPIIGFVCQYTVMPLVAFGVGMALDLPPNILLGYFAMGCAPGGGSSNFFTYLLGGDVSLSITMTLISTLTALGMVPLWLFTLGRYILKRQEHNVNIPFANIMISLVTMVVPIATGYLIKRKLPKVAAVINKAMKPFLFMLFIFFFTGGVYANFYIFKLFSPIVIAAGCLLPYLGFALGGLVAFLVRLSSTYVRTVAIETGIQNTGVPIFMLKFSLPQPDSDISIVGPIASSMFTPFPLFVLALAREIRRRCRKRRRASEEEEELEAEGEKEEKARRRLEENGGVSRDAEVELKLMKG